MTQQYVKIPVHPGADYDANIERMARAAFEATKPYFNKNVGWDVMAGGLPPRLLKARFRAYARAAVAAAWNRQRIQDEPTS